MIDFLAVLQQQVEQHLRERQAGRERQDAGVRVSGSRKELAALRKLALNPAELLNAEASPSAAAALVRKSQVLPRPDFEAWQREDRLPPAVAGALFVLWKAFPEQPRQPTPFARMAYVRLARDLAAFIEAQAASPTYATVPALVDGLRSEVMGWQAGRITEIRKLVDSSKFTGSAEFTLAQDRALSQVLAGVRRFMPADDFVRWLLYVVPRESWKWEETAQLTRLLYDFPDPTGLVSQEPGADELQREEPPQWSRLTLWRFAADQVAKSKAATRWLASLSLAHPEERTNMRYGEQRQYSAYLPRLLDLYYGSNFASCCFPATMHKLPAQGRGYGYMYRITERTQLYDHPQLLALDRLGAPTWAEVATVLKLGAAPTPRPTPTGGVGASASAENVPLSHIRRKGGVLVTDLQVSEQFLLQDFGFRAVEYGNYVRDAEGTEHLRHCIAALTDLCDVLNLSPRRANEAGGLAIGFGSRGQGGRAVATYHPSERIINLTKSRGDGSLAHEWLHYFDNLLMVHLAGAGVTPGREPFGSVYAAAQTYLYSPELTTDAAGRLKMDKTATPSAARKAKQRQEKEQTTSALTAARREISWTGFADAQQVREVIQLLGRLWQAIRFGYYTQGTELRATQPGATRMQLYVSSGKRMSTGLTLPAVPVTGTIAASALPYFLGAELRNLLAQVRAGRLPVAMLWEKMLNGRIGYSSVFTLGPLETPATCAYAGLFARIAHELDLPELRDVVFYRPVVSEFYQYAASHKNAAYLADPAELFARSFERFVHDELAARGQANNYLVDGDKFSRNSTYYPAGAEANFINQAWRELLAYLAGPVGLGPFSAPWAEGKRVDEYLALDKSKSGGEQVSGGVITAAPAPAAPNRQLALAKAKAKALALAIAIARQREPAG